MIARFSAATPYILPTFYAPPPRCFFQRFFRAYLCRLDMFSNEGKQNFQLHTPTNSLTQMSLQQSDGVKVKK